ncbi:MAG: zinc ribbon domain-containing protein [Clostridia bacterium]|nr:zinc ribbon domain-containing protein [Clostridia bacterium]MBQ8469509.1 zinc ribbon domain-containing protein [Clostridia bacterium]MBR1704749.1 zinc ribbon domain-containing protein [Clostridia bacterium]
MYCKSCGRVVPDDALYCPTCGNPLEKVNGAQSSAGSAQNAGPTAKEQKEMDLIQQRLNSGRLYGVISIVCSILGLGSFGSLDIIAIICGYLGLKQLKSVPNTYPEKHTAVTLNRAGIICSAGFIFLIIAFVIIALIAFPWIFASIAGFFAGLI